MQLDIVEHGNRTLKALIVEDEPESVDHLLIKSRRFIKNHSGKLLYEFATALDEAAEKMSHSHYGLVIVDMGLPTTHKRDRDFREEGGKEFICSLQNGSYGDDKIDTKFMVVTAQDLCIDKDEIDKRNTCLGIFSKLQVKAMEVAVKTLFKDLLLSPSFNNINNGYIDHNNYYIELNLSPHIGCLSSYLHHSKKSYALASRTIGFTFATKKPISAEELSSDMLLEQPMTISLDSEQALETENTSLYGAICIFESGEIGSFGEAVHLSEDRKSFIVDFSNIADFIDPGINYIEQHNKRWSVKSSGLLVVIKVI